MLSSFFPLRKNKIFFSGSFAAVCCIPVWVGRVRRGNVLSVWDSVCGCKQGKKREGNYCSGG